MLHAHSISSQYPDRLTLVFLHGFLGSHRDFLPLATQLSQSNRYNCLLIDLPGHGNSGSAIESIATFPDAAQAILTTLESHKISLPILYGYSMGGRLALYLALTFPDRFTAAILESTSPGLETLEQQEARRQQDEKLAQSLESDFPNFLKSWYQTDLFRSLTQHPSFPELLDRRHHNNPKALARSLRVLGTGSQTSLWPKLSQAQIPLMLLVGQQDSKFCAINQKMSNRCPIAHLHVIPHAGHNLHVEAPSQILSILQNIQF